MTSADEALRIILDAARPMRRERVRLDRASGRTAAEEVRARTDIPPFENSAMDGFAVFSQDLALATAERPVTLTLAGESSAGNPHRRPLKRGTAVRIMTGGKVPPGADAVIPRERASAEADGTVTCSYAPPEGAFVRRKGEDIPHGSRVILAGDLLTPFHVGLLASLGLDSVRVACRPSVGILATGDELVAPGAPRRPGQIHNSSSYTLTGLALEAGAVPRFLGIARDRKEMIKRRIRSGLRGDILLLTGGVSVGARDYVREALEECGVSILFWRVNIRPGGPLLVGVRGGTLVFGLPGNPVSTAVTFLEFVRPALRRMLGRTHLTPSRLTAVADAPLAVRDGKRSFLRGVAHQEGGVLHVKPTASQSSGVLSSLVSANCLIVLPEETQELPAGSAVTIEFFHDPISPAHGR